MYLSGWRVYRSRFAGARYFRFSLPVASAVCGVIRRALSCSNIRVGCRVIGWGWWWPGGHKVKCGRRIVGRSLRPHGVRARKFRNCRFDVGSWWRHVRVRPRRTCAIEARPLRFLYWIGRVVVVVSSRSLSGPSRRHDGGILNRGNGVVLSSLTPFKLYSRVQTGKLLLHACCMLHES
jgi:hypothetical protein